MHNNTTSKQITYISKKKSRTKCPAFFNGGDPYENRTRVTAVKGRCLNRLTNGPCGCYLKNGSGNWIRTSDTPGMNRML